MIDASLALFAPDSARNTQPSSSLWYATDLSRWEDATAQIACEQDLLLHEKAYRRLTPEYYAWLRSRMTHAQEKHRRGLLPAAVYDQLCERFNVMQDDAVQLYGEATLLAVLDSLDLQGYEPPSAQSASRLLALLQDAQSAGTTPQESLLGSGSARALWPDPTAPPNLAVGVPVRILGGGEGIVTVLHAAEPELPGGWVEITTTDGQRAQADTRYLTDIYGRRFVPMTYTPYEQRAISLAAAERPEDFDDILPDLNYPTTGTLPFTEKVELLDYFKVEEIKDTALGLGWSHPELFQNRGRFAMPCGQDYGLICFVHGRVIGAVTSEAIELLPEQGNREQCTRFYHPHRQEVTHVSAIAT